MDSGGYRPMPRKVIYPPADLIEKVAALADDDAKLESESETWAYLARQGLQLEERDS